MLPIEIVIKGKRKGVSLLLEILVMLGMVDNKMRFNAK